MEIHIKWLDDSKVIQLEVRKQGVKPKLYQQTTKASSENVRTLFDKLIRSITKIMKEHDYD
jgi:prophage maintenance system killer protein